MLQIGIILWIVLGAFFALEWMGRRMGRRAYACLVWFVFAVYVFGNLYFTLLSRTPGTETHVTLMPFASYARLGENVPMETGDAAGFAGAFLRGTTPLDGIILNVLLYVPLGYLLPRLFPGLKIWQVILIGLCCSAATEAIQYVFQMGWCETDDAIHNTLGAAIGVWMQSRQTNRMNR